MIFMMWARCQIKVGGVRKEMARNKKRNAKDSDLVKCKRRLPQGGIDAKVNDERPLFLH